MGKVMTWMYEYAVTELDNKGKPVQKMFLSEEVPDGIEKNNLRRIKVAVYKFG